MNPIPFFEFARKRHNIYLARLNGETSPWTDDPVLHKFRFTNVYRELDAVTIWFEQNVRGPLRDKEEVLLATVLFRFFNRITTGEAIFKLQHPEGNVTPWEIIKNYDSDGMIRDVKVAIQKHCGKGPYVTGSYIIKSPNGMDKLTGVLWAVEQFMTQKREWSRGVIMDSTSVAAATKAAGGTTSLEQMWDWLRKFPFLGDFTAYEIVTDLRHTCLLENAPDIYTWANPGPGAMRGLNRLNGLDKDKSAPKHVFVCGMRELLEMAQNSSIWPHRVGELPVEMRDIEHTLCEFDKYERARLGDGRPRGVYRHVT